MAESSNPSSLASPSAPSSYSLGLSSISDVTAIAKALNFTLPNKLSGDNYSYWKIQVKSAVRGLGLKLLLEKAPPPSTSDLTELDREIWVRTDHLLMVWFVTNISDSVIGNVADCKSSFEIWSVLESLFAQASMARALQLKQQLNTLKKVSIKISEFVLKIKSVGSELKSIGQVITDSDLIQSVLNGLGHEFDPVVVLVSSQQSTMSLQDAQYLLMLHEQRIERLN
ncbi:hypothetical protein Scep_030070 [Stephania cephalantha]|uniref:Gag-pol polyprotein n=1 Tax=Stephania cephalantha TaxID=152367 RepID=A0AAP0DYV5_9MAGN